MDKKVCEYYDICDNKECRYYYNDIDSETNVIFENFASEYCVSYIG